MSKGFLKLSHSLVDCPAFTDASAGATRLLILLWRRFNGRNNGDIPCSVREAAAWCKCGKSAAAAYFIELQERGLISPVSKGRFTSRGARQNVATKWLLTFLPSKQGGPDVARA